MAWYNEKVQQVRKEFAEKCIKVILQAPDLSEHGFDIPASKIKADVIAHIRAMAIPSRTG